MTTLTHVPARIRRLQRAAFRNPFTTADAQFTPEQVADFDGGVRVLLSLNR